MLISVKDISLASLKALAINCVYRASKWRSRWRSAASTFYSRPSRCGKRLNWIALETFSHNLSFLNYILAAVPYNNRIAVPCFSDDRAERVDGPRTGNELSFASDIALALKVVQIQVVHYYYHYTLRELLERSLIIIYDIVSSLPMI